MWTSIVNEEENLAKTGSYSLGMRSDNILCRYLPWEMKFPNLMEIG